MLSKTLQRYALFHYDVLVSTSFLCHMMNFFYNPLIFSIRIALSYFAESCFFLSFVLTLQHV